MALIERLMGLDARPKIPVHAFQAIAGEWATGSPPGFTGAQAQTAIAAVSAGVNLDAGEQAEAQTLVNSITSIPITGTAVQIADGRARRAQRAGDIDRVLLLADALTPPYDTPAAVRTRLGL